MDELASQIRSYYEATTEPTPVGMQVADTDGAPRAGTGARSDTDTLDHDGRDPADEMAVVLTLQDAPRRERRHRRRHALLAIAAAVAAIIAGVLLYVADDGHDVEVPSAPPSTQADDASTARTLDVAERFLDEWAAGDGAAVADLFDRGGGIEIGREGPLGAVDGPSVMPALHDWYRAAGFEFRARGCQLTTTPFELSLTGTAEAFCSLTYESALTRYVGRPPLTENFWLTIRGGKLQAVSSSHFFDADADIGFVFKEWVASHHPSDVDRMYNAADSLAPRADPVSISLWERHIDEFTASTDSTARLAGDPRSMAEYGARVRVICAAADVRYEQERVSAPPSGPAPFAEATARIGSESLEELRTLRPPVESDELDLVFSQMEQEIELEARAAAAAEAGDDDLAEQLSWERVDVTHSRSYAPAEFDYCPVGLGA